MHSCGHRSSNVSSNGISKGENIGESFVLKGIWIDIDQAIGIGETGVDKVLPWFTWWVEVSVSETRFNNLSGINILESSNFFSNFTIVDLKELPSKHNFNASLMAFVKSDFVGITKFENFFVWSPVLNFR